MKRILYRSSFLIFSVVYFAFPLYAQNPPKTQDEQYAWEVKFDKLNIRHTRAMINDTSAQFLEVRNETSLMLNYRPDLVDLSQLSKSRADKPLGVWGEDPRDATAAYGAECMNSAVEIMIRKFREAGV